MSLTDLKHKLAQTLRPAPADPPVSPVELGPSLLEGDRVARDAEDDFEGEGWSFWGV